MPADLGVKNTIQTDFLVIGAGIVGLALARELRARNPSASILVVEKEPAPALHASGRNSGVLHAGFYYTPDSFKAKFCMEGNRELKEFCRARNLPLLECGKVVVARDEAELATLSLLGERGQKNGSGVKLVTAAELAEIEPNARTHERALYSPETAVVDPLRVCQELVRELSASGVRFEFSSGYSRRLGQQAILAGGKTTVEFSRLFNAAGLYADRIARDFGFAKKLLIVPFKGVYLKSTEAPRALRTHVYPVPNIANPFLGVHFTLTVDGATKIGPTAIPSFWRENYSGWHGFNLREFLEVIGVEANLFLRNSFGFRDLAFQEMRKYDKEVLLDEASTLVRKLDRASFNAWARPGIRAQLVDLETRKLVSDFVVESDASTVHVLNAVSPAFSSSFPFARWVVENAKAGGAGSASHLGRFDEPANCFSGPS